VSGKALAAGPSDASDTPPGKLPARAQPLPVLQRSENMRHVHQLIQALLHLLRILCPVRGHSSNGTRKRTQKTAPESARATRTAAAPPGRRHPITTPFISFRPRSLTRSRSPRHARPQTRPRPAAARRRGLSVTHPFPGVAIAPDRPARGEKWQSTRSRRARALLDPFLGQNLPPKAFPPIAFPRVLP